MDYAQSPFSTPRTRQATSVPVDTDIVFVADMFPEDYVGGAELTSQALIDSSPLRVFKLHARDVTIETLKSGHTKYWIFGNATQMDHNLIPTIVGNMRYSVLEYDYKYCRARSPEKHKEMTGAECDCHNQQIGKIISAFFYGADQVWWMSEAQKEHYIDRFPFLADKVSMVLSSVFSHETLGTLKFLREQIRTSSTPRKGWIVLGSTSWIKGAQQAEKWCKDNGKDYEIVWNMPYDRVLDKLAHAEGFVYLPVGRDTCPRMVIEAKLLGCEVHVNEFVQHAKEPWFNTDDLTTIEEYLYSAHKTFWSATKRYMDYKPTISGYTTTLNCVKQGYPFEQCIQSMLAFCDEVCIIDGGSTDGTWEKLVELTMKPDKIYLEDLDDLDCASTIEISKNGAMSSDKKIRIKQVTRDWSHPHSSVFDGANKAEARKMCKGEFCWQMDCDEVVTTSDATRIPQLCRVMPKEVDVLSLPVIEYWGGYEKVRIDVLPWKWRLSRNKQNITHGIPTELRRYDDKGELYAAEGTDGCDVIDVGTGQRIPHLSFYDDTAHSARMYALRGDPKALEHYKGWFNRATKELPSVHHYSWYDMPRKIRLYRDYWTQHWLKLFGKDTRDTPENNMFFDVPWSEVTDEMIEKRAKEIVDGTGGWIWHKKWTGQRIPHITCDMEPPDSMSGWGKKK